jgi:hypothetical protein
MIWRLTYCNKKGVEARVDIIKSGSTSVEIVEGSANPFTLSYKLDKNDKSGHIMTSSADIEFFETEEFNIDKLKTSNETELKVEYFEDNVLTWSGFILPDFFSREIGSPNIVRMTASDRLTALKGVTLSDLPAKVSLRNLIELSLEQTGLTLSLASQININQGSTNILDSEVLSQRLTDTRGRSISCYDILMSIMVATNSTIRQRKGQWQVYNKLEHELRAPTIFFDKVERGAIRTIQPVASSVGVYQEFGGRRLHPDNYDFSEGNTGWVASGGFPFTIATNQIVGYTRVNNVWTVNFGDTDKSRMQINKIYEGAFSNTDLIAYVSNTFPVITESDTSVNVEIDISVTGRPRTTARAIVIADNGTNKLAFNPSQGAFEPYDPQRYDIMGHSVFFINLTPQGEYLGNEKYNAATKSIKYSATLEATAVQDYSISIRFYGTDSYNARVIPIFVNFASIRFSNTEEAPKGNIFKTTQGANYTKLHDVETVIFGDYITSGLNGYFYNYPIDETSNLYLPSGELSSPTWVTAFDPTERPLLHHISRQKSRLFSVAHDILKANISVESFDPLAIFQDCRDRKYVVVSASFDFLRSEADVELEQIAYDNTILKRDFIYSYFGEGESNIKSIGGIAGGGGSTGGGGMTSGQLEMLTNLANWWKLDEDNDAIYSEKSVYSLKGVSALGYNDDGGGGSGGGVDMLDSWANYTSEKADYYAPASLLVPFRNDTLSRLASLEAGGGAIDIDIATTGSGNAVTGVSKSGNTLTFAKGSTFSLSNHNHNTLYKPIGYVPSWGEVTGKPTTFTPSAHTHSASDITSGTLTIARIPTGTTGTTVALGNDSRIANGQTAYGWGNHASAGYALNSALSGYVPTTRTITAGNGLTGGGTLSANRTLTLGTPSNITLSSTNSVTSSSHTHAITTTTVGLANTIVATDASGGVRGNIIRIGGDWTLELSGTELVFKYQNVIKQRMLSDGTILATGGVTALST